MIITSLFFLNIPKIQLNFSFQFLSFDLLNLHHSWKATPPPPRNKQDIDKRGHENSDAKTIYYKLYHDTSIHKANKNQYKICIY